MRGLPAAVVGFGCSVVPAATVWADGSLPPQPYHYLHPPAALAGSNSPPTSGHLTVAVDSGRSHGGFAFSSDGQVGLIVHPGAFRAAASTTSVNVLMQPVDTPAGLPAQIVADGNAYRITALGQPGNLHVSLAQEVNLTLKWPHLPIAIYAYRDGAWRQVCYSDHAVITTPTISCSISTFGIFVAVTTPFNAGTHIPTTPISSTPLAWLNQYLALLGAIALILMAIVLGFFVTRPDKPAGSRNSDS